MRKLRILKDNASYHVTARTNHRELLLSTEVMKTLFIDLVMRAQKKHRFEIDNFVIMGNHFHFIIIPGTGENLSVIMKWILQTFAQRYNKMTKSSGHFWGGRFFSWIIPNFWEYIRVFKYIDDNPVRANLADTPKNWPFSGLAWRRRGLQNFLSKLPHWMLALFPDHQVLLLEM